MDDSVAKPYFNATALGFLRTLERNNRREWFEPRKAVFEQELKRPMLALIEEVTGAMAGFAPEFLRPAQKTMMRIYRDTRFSSDKRPYKTHLAAWWSHEGFKKTSGAGYYLQISHKGVEIAAGVYMPQPEQLLAIRMFLLDHHEQVRRLLQEARRRKFTNPSPGTPLSRSPKGFPKNHPAMDLLLCRQWGVGVSLPPEAALERHFAREVIQCFRLATPVVQTLNCPLVHQAVRRRPIPFGLP